jgi:hypothetical protein
MKKISVFILVLVLLLLPITSLYSCEAFEKMTNATVIGEVMYVKANSYMLQDGVDISFLNYRLYIKPLGQPEDAEWIVFRVDENTDMESAFCNNVDDMVELSIGAIVKITFNTSFEKIVGGHGKSYYTKTIKIADDDDMKINNPEFDLVYFKDHKSYFGTDRCTTEGKVIHVAKANCAEGGYIVYIDFYEGESVLRRFWINSETALDTAVEELMPNDLVGHVVEINNFDTYPFYNRDIRLCFAISLVD